MDFSIILCASVISLSSRAMIQDKKGNLLDIDNQKKYGVA